MSSIKQLKKNINNLSAELFSECVFCRLYVKNTDTERIDKIIVKILQNQNEFIKRTQHPNGKDNSRLVKEHYKTLATDIKKHIENILSEIENIYN